MTVITRAFCALSILAIALSLANSAFAQQTLAPGASVRGTLTSSDTRDDEGRYYDTYVLRARAGQSVRVIMVAPPPFDSLLRVTGPGNFSTENDDDGSSLNSAIEFVAPRDGEYRIVATTYESGAEGGYTLSFNAPATAAQAGPPSPRPQQQPTGPAPGQVRGPQDIPPEAWAQMPDEVIAQMPPEWRAYAARARQAAAAPPPAVQVGTPLRATLQGYDDVYSVRLRAGQQLHITLTSDVFDTHLAIEGPGGFEADNNNQYGEMYGAERDYRGDIYDSALYLVAPATGDYRITVSDNEEGQSSGAYILAVTELPRLVVGRDISGELTQSDRKGLSGENMDVFAYTAARSETLNIRMTATDFAPVIAIFGPDRYSEQAGGGGSDERDADLRLTLPSAGEYRIEFRSWRPQDVGPYVVQTSHGAIAQARPTPRTVENSLPSDCNAALVTLRQQLARMGSNRGLQYSEVMMQQARAHLCLNDFAAADADYAAVVQANGGGSPDWTDAILSRIALAEMRGDYAGAQRLRTYMIENINLGGLRYAGRFEQFGHTNYIIDPVDNLALLEFAIMIEIARTSPQEGMAVLSGRYQTMQNSGRTELATRAAALYTRFSGQAAASVTECGPLVQMGTAFTMSGQPEAGAAALRRALTAGRGSNRPNSGGVNFRCGNRVDGSGSIVEERDVVVALAQSLILANRPMDAVTELQTWLRAAPTDHIAAASLGYAYENARDTSRALEAWRTAIRIGADRVRNFEGGSIHEQAGDAFIRLGAPADAAAAYERGARAFQSAVGNQARTYINALFAQAALSARLANQDTREPLGCPAQRGAIDVSRFGAPGNGQVTYANRSYLAYCRAWATQAANSPDAQRTLSQLLAYTREHGADGEGEVQALVEASMEADWAASGQRAQ